MEKAKALSHFAICLGLLIAIATSCSENNAPVENAKTYIPAKPDYTDQSLRFTRENDATGNGADILYFVSTWEADWTTDAGEICHYADVYNPQHRADMDKEISRIAEYMGNGNNFYSPYYRHTTIEAWVTQNEDTVRSRFMIPNEDIQNAFGEYLRRRDSQRPFVLAGFSQGAKAVVELLKAMPDSLHQYLVAAYVLGYKVTPEDTLATTNIRAAQDSTDIGVTICYNSVSDIQYIKPVVAEPCANVHKPSKLAYRCHPGPVARHHHRHPLARTSRSGA